MTLRIDQAALASMVYNSGIVQRTAREMRDEARVNAEVISSKTDAIDIETGADSLGFYTDLGYRRRHPGFFLWWWEVGTRNHKASPHLRPTVRRRF